VRTFGHRLTTSQLLPPLTKVIARKRSILRRHPVLKVFQPSRIIPLIITPPPLIPLLHHHLLRRRSPMALPIIPRTRPRTVSSMALLQLIPRLHAETKNLPFNTRTQTRRPALASLDAGGRFGRALAGGSAVDGAGGVFVAVHGLFLRDEHVVGPALDAAGVVVHGVGDEVGAFVAVVGAAAVGVVLAVFESFGEDVGGWFVERSGERVGSEGDGQQG
jgi:hypothetical protein